MNHAVLLVPDFVLHALRRSDPTLAGHACALIAGEGKKAIVTAVSPEAAGVPAAGSGVGSGVVVDGCVQAARIREMGNSNVRVVFDMVRIRNGAGRGRHGAGPWLAA